MTTLNLATTLVKKYCYSDNKYINTDVIIDEIKIILDNMIKTTQFNMSSA